MFFITPASLSVFSTILPMILLLVFLLQLQKRNLASRWLTVYLGFGLLTMLSLLVIVSLPLPHPAIPLAGRALQLFALFTVLSPIQHAYYFTGILPQRQREAWFVLNISIGCVLVYFAVVVLNMIGRVGEIVPDIIFVMILGLKVIWQQILLLRQLWMWLRMDGPVTWRRLLMESERREVRAYRALLVSSVFLFPVVPLSLPGIASSLQSLLLPLITGVAMIYAFVTVAVHLNYVTEPFSLSAKITSTIVFLVFTILSPVGYFFLPLLSTSYVNQAERDQVLLADNSLIFTPTSAENDPTTAYTFVNKPMGISSEYGTCQPLSDRDVIVDVVTFQFPFYGNVYEQLFIGRDGYISFHDRQRAPDNYNSGIGVIIAPLLADYVSSPHDQICIQTSAEHIVVTWVDVVYRGNDNHTLTFQVQLAQNGEIMFSYDDPMITNLLWASERLMIGIAPKVPWWQPYPQTGLLEEQRLVAADQMPLIYSFNFASFQYLHDTLRLVLFLHLFAALAVVIGIPLYLNYTLLRPMGDLVSHIDHLNSGAYVEPYNVVIMDEIGYLTMTLDNLYLQLTAHQNQLAQVNADLEQQVRERTAQLAMTLQDAISAVESQRFFMANVSHEFRTPLNAILGYVRLLRQRDPTITEYDVIERSGHHLLMLVDDVLDLTRAEAGQVVLKPSAVDLQSFVPQIASMFQLRATNSSVTFQYWLDTALPAQIWADERRLRQVLINLLNNAFKYTSAGSISLQISRQSDKIWFAVTDTGIGIPQEKREAILQPFYQLNLDQPRGGVGLGLAISNQLLEVMESKLDVESREGIGSRFSFSLPLPDDADWLISQLPELMVAIESEQETHLALPHKTTLHGLLQAAQIGDVMYIKQTIGRLREEEEGYQTFVSILNQMTQQYRMAALRDWLTELLEQ